MRLFRKKSPIIGAIAPEVPFTAIGDIHGRCDLLQRALAVAEDQIVCVGDYVDRGPDSAGVLRLLKSRPDIICLMGNHEEMMLDFLQDPETRGARWLHHGGVQTLASFGISYQDGDALAATRDALRAAMGDALEAWLTARPSFWQSGNVAVVHAAADPTRPLSEQTTKALRWGHRDFGKKARYDGMWVLRGHVIVDAPTVMDGIIAIDTGAHATGRLTLAHVDTDDVRFETA